MILKKSNEKIFPLDSQAILIAFTIIGFEFISFFAEGFGQSRLITLPYRAAYILLVLYIVIKRKIFKTVPYSFLPLLIFSFFYFIRSLIDLAIRYNEVKDYVVEFYLFCFVLGFLPMLPLLLDHDKITLNKAKSYTLILAGITNIWGFKNNFFTVEEDLTGRFLANEILNQISYGQTGVILIILSITSFFNTSSLKKCFLLAFIILGIANIALAASRGPLIELTVCVLLFLIMKRKMIGRRNLFFIASAFLVAVIYYSDKIVLFTTLIDRLSGTGFNTDSGNEERYYLFTEGWESFIKNPLFGDKLIGIYPHNLIIESFMALGILGGVLMIIVFIFAISDALKAVKSPDFTWLGLLLIMQIIASLISGAIFNSYLLWALIALVANLNRKKFIHE